MRVLSTKILLPNQRELLLNAGVQFVEYNAITITPAVFNIPDSVTHAIVTSQHGAKAILNAEYSIQHLYCVGEKTAALLIENGLQPVQVAENAAELAQCIVANYPSAVFHYFCGTMRRDELPHILQQAGITCHEIIVYKTTLNYKVIPGVFDGILCYSPSGVDAFAKANSLSNTTAFCIGETTAAQAKKYTERVIVANSTRIESVIAKAVKTLKQEVMSPRAQSRGHVK